jgi:hypothetical protein
MTFSLESTPVDATLTVPFAPLAELAAGEDELASRVRPHPTEQRAQAREALPLVARHLRQQGSLAVHDFVVTDREDEILRERVQQTEREIAVMPTAMDRIVLEVRKVSCIHPMFHL